jgi:hypothetical protein
MVGLRCRAAQISQGGAAAPPYQNKNASRETAGRFYFAQNWRRIFAAYPVIRSLSISQKSIARLDKCFVVLERICIAAGHAVVIRCINVNGIVSGKVNIFMVHDVIFTVSDCPK